eukprot:UN10007
MQLVFSLKLISVRKISYEVDNLGVSHAKIFFHPKSILGSFKPQDPI